MGHSFQDCAAHYFSNFSVPIDNVESWLHRYLQIVLTPPHDLLCKKHHFWESSVCVDESHVAVGLKFYDQNLKTTAVQIFSVLLQLPKYFND